MPGIRHDSKADIQLIHRILRAGYEDGFPVLKELLQNSDDAGAGRVGQAASTIAIVLAPYGLPGAAHSQLRRPAICVLNDGEFRQSDAECLTDIELFAIVGSGQAGLVGGPAENENAITDLIHQRPRQA